MKVIQNQLVRNELLENMVLVNCRVLRCDLIGCRMIGGDVDNALIEKSVLIDVKVKDIDHDESHFISCTTF